MRAPRYIKADVQRAMLDAYYRYVCGCTRVLLGADADPGAPWVAWAARPDRIWVMDFSSLYEFPETMKPATVTRRLTERALAAAQEGRYRADPVTGVRPPVSYEVWCFIPPSERLLAALHAAHSSGAPVDLVPPEAVAERIRQTVLAVPDDSDEQAFVAAAALIRRAFGLRGPAGAAADKG